MTLSQALPNGSYVFVDRPEALGDTIERLRGTRAVAVDTEADSMHCFFEKVCLLQLAGAEGPAYLVDPLALKGGMSDLSSAFADPRTVKVFHGADFDVAGLRRDFGFEFRGIFDTMLAGQLLGDEKLSLRDYVERYFGVKLEKAYTRCDWSRRPLDEHQLEYCFHDVAFLVPLMDIQRSRLVEADLVEEAEIEFERLSRREPARRDFDPHAWFRLPGAKDLAHAEQAAAAHLFLLRDRMARETDRPAFKVLANDALVRIARAMPRTVDELRRMRGVSSFVAGRMGRSVLDALEQARRDGAPPPRPRRSGDPERRLDMPAQKRLARLKNWRNAASQASGVTTMAILPNYAMFEVARLQPRGLEELAAIPGVGTKRAARWGRDILDTLS
jgi:ribonuclease D